VTADKALMLGISVVVTTLNDRAGLELLLPALASQTRPPDELIVVDGGSRDGTLELLEQWSDRLPLRVLDAPGANISAGRNVGIRAASSFWIACTDAGCEPEPGWLEAIDAAREGVDFVAGIYVVDPHTPLEQALAVALYPVREELVSSPPLVRAWQRVFGRRFEVEGATGRSIAFTRTVWEALDGFPEELYAGEDVAFSRAAVRSGFRARLASAAAVAWRPRPTWRANARMYWLYGRGSVRRGGSLRHVLRFAGWAFVVAAAARRTWPARLASAGGIGAYLSVPVLRARRARVGPAGLVRIPGAIALKDFALLAGAGAGMLDALRHRDGDVVSAPAVADRSA